MSVEEQAHQARSAALILSRTTRAAKDAALYAMADALGKAETAVLEANARDVQRAEAARTGIALIDRLRLTADRIAQMTDGLRDLAALPDPVGDVVRGWTNANGVQVRQIRVPFGVVGIIYEARPNVTADAGGICLKSGNAALLRGRRRRPTRTRRSSRPCKPVWSTPACPPRRSSSFPGRVR